VVYIVYRLLYIAFFKLPTFIPNASLMKNIFSLESGMERMAKTQMSLENI